ncbi:MAG: NAD-dependent epimerase/dehydratase family protein [Caulobacterales bacterium]|nr:NAD-dependent epimerase/dehydratase family protein [Caulobacterales bacterium]MCA0373386.1 NAD-dependent epimerase/dehydratase family protein [Pseudomonadota bacterium]
MTNQRVLITGGAGCLGANIIDRYGENGNQYLVIDNFATSDRAVLEGFSKSIQVIEGSVYDRELVDSAFDKFRPTHVVHSAASYKDPDNWQEDANTNIDGTINVAKASIRHDVRRFINFQTSLCYGIPNETPIPITHPVQPFSSYGISKAAGEQYLLMSGLPVVSLRLANVTGPRLSIGPIPTFYTRLKAGKGCFCSDSVRDFLDMSDFFSLFDLVLQDDAPTGVFNVSTGKGNTIKDVFDEVVKYLGITLKTEVPIIPVGADDTPIMVLDATVTEKTFNWKAKVDFEQTIKKMLQWYDVNGVATVYSHVKKPEGQE